MSANGGGDCRESLTVQLVFPINSYPFGSELEALFEIENFKVKTIYLRKSIRRRLKYY